MSTTSSVLPLTANSSSLPPNDPLPSAYDLTLDANFRSSRVTTKQLLAMYAPNDTSRPPPPTLILHDLEGKHSKSLDLFSKIKIGRTTSSRTQYSPNNGFFDSKVLSRAHAEVWFENNQVLLQDLGSSNGTFLNGNRLADENQASDSIPIKDGDKIDFGVDILNENGTGVLYKKVSLTVRIIPHTDSNSSVGSTTSNYLSSNHNDSTATMTRLNASRVESAMANNFVNNSTRQSEELTRKVDQLAHEINSLRTNNTDLQKQLSQAVQDKSLLQQQLQSAQKQLVNSSTSDTNISTVEAEVNRLKQDKIALQGKIVQLETQLAQTKINNKSQVSSPISSNHTPVASVVRPPRHQSSIFSTLLLTLIALCLSIYVYMYYFDGLAVVDPIAKDVIGVSITEMISITSYHVHETYSSTKNTILMLYKQTIHDEL